MERKPQSFRELAAIAEQYLTAHNKKLSSRDFNAKKSVGAPRPEGKIPDVSPTTTGSIKCFSCRRLGYKARECFRACKIKEEKGIATDAEESIILSCSAKKEID